MKLLDLLKSLNGGQAINPDINTAALDPNIDTTAPLHTPAAANTDNRKRLLTELTSIAELLDAPTENPEPAKIAATTSGTESLLNIEHIFGESEELNDLTVAEACTSPLLFMPTENPTATVDNRKQIIQSLLDDLLPIFEKALGERLSQLDDITLQQWQQTLLDTADNSLLYKS